MKKKLLSVLLVLALAVPACAADWPAKSIRMIVPFAAGGGTDLVARALAASAEKILGQPIAIINKTGAMRQKRQPVEGFPIGFLQQLLLNRLQQFPQCVSLFLHNGYKGSK